MWPRLEHSTGYAAFGRVNGYYQEARWVLHSRRVITFNYDASFYRTANGAYRAWRDGSSYDLKFPGVRALACPPGIRLSCTRLYIPYSNRYDAFYDLIQHGRCLAELRALARPKPFNKRKSRMASTLATMDRAASARLEGVCR